jgi:O-antigen ligase
VKRWWPLGAFVGWGLVVPLLAGQLPSGAGAARLCDWLLVPVAAVAVTRVRSLAPVAVAAAVTCLLSCFVAALQHFGVWPPLETFAPLAFTKIPFHRVYEPTGDGRFMAGGLTFHRLKFANVTAMVIIVAAAHWRQGRAAALATIGFVSVAVFPAARAAAAALALSLATLIRPRWIAAGLLGVVALAGLWQRPGGERLELLQSGLNAVAAHPLAGTGLGRFKPADYAQLGAPAQVMEHAGKAHNQLVTLAAEGGVVHAALFVVLLAWLLRQLLKTPPSAARGAGLAGLVFFALLSLLHDPLFHAIASQALVLLLGGALGLSRRREPAPT